MQPQHVVIADPHMSVEERAQALNWLHQSHQEFAASIDGLSAAQWNWKPAPHCWSVGETAEHIVLAEALLFNFVQKCLTAPPNPAWEEQTKGKTELLARALLSRADKANAPEPVVPRKGLTHAQVKEQFENQRIVMVQFAAETELPLKQHTIDHPFPRFGTLNAFQWFINAPLHTIRHGQQIAEIKASPGYPSH